MSVPEVQLARGLSDEVVAILPAPGVSVTDALGLYVEYVQVVSRIIADCCFYLQPMLLLSILEQASIN